MKLQEAEKKLKLNLNDLDNEVKHYSDTLWRVSEQFALAVSKTDTLKKELKEIKAEVFIKYAVNFKENGLEKKPSDGLVKELVIDDEQVRKINKEYFEAKLQSDLWEGMVTSHERRGSMIHRAGDLWEKNYYADRSIKKVEGSEFSSNRREERVSEKRKSGRPKRR